MLAGVQTQSVVSHIGLSITSDLYRPTVAPSSQYGTILVDHKGGRFDPLTNADVATLLGKLHAHLVRAACACEHQEPDRAIE